MSKEQRECIECGGEMQKIKLIDKGHFNTHSELEYAAGDARTRFWSGGFPVEGKVAALMCQLCGRIALFGEPKI